MPYISEEKLNKITALLEQFTNRATAERWHQRHQIPGRGIALPGIGKEGEDLARGFGDFVRCVAAGRILNNTPEFVRDAFNRALSEGSDPAGGFMVPEIFIPELLHIVEDYGVMRKLCRVIPMQTDTSNLLSLIAGVQVYWPSENQTITQSDPVFGRPILHAKTMAAITSSSAELLADSGIELGMLLMQLFGEAIALEEDRCILVGNNDPFYGVLFASSVNQVTMGTGLSAFTDVTFQDVSDLIAGVTSAAARNARFFLHRSVLELLKRTRDLNHQYIWAPPTQETPAAIWGYPYTLSDAMPSSTGASTNFIAFGNPQNILLGDRKKMTVDVSTDVGFKQNEVFYRVTERIAVLTGIPAAFSRLRTAS